MTSADESFEATLAHTDAGSVSASDRTDGSDSVELAPGTAVGRYTVLAQVGAGAMGVVFEAYDRDLDRRVAVKLLQRGQSAELLREAQAMAKLAHPHVVAVYDVGTVRLGAGTQVFVAMEFLSGGTLGEWLELPDRDPDSVLEVFLAAGEGLAAAHRVGLVHRDFKPDNVLMTVAGSPKVTDFGLAHSTGHARLTDTGSHELEANTDTQTGSTGSTGAIAASLHDSETTRSDIGSKPKKGRWCGTPAYMAPELFRGGEASERSDQWSFCIALYEAVYGERPFSGTSLVSLGVSICQNRRDPTPTHVVVPRRVLDVLERGLATDPAARFADMDDLLDALRPPVAKRSMGWAASIASVGLVAGLGIGVLFLRDHDEPAVPNDPCASASASVDALWSDPARQRLRGAVEATHSSEGSDVSSAADHLIADLDRYAAAIAAARTQACVRHDSQQDTDLVHERRGLCLGAREDALAGLLDALHSVDAAQVDHLLGAASKLPSLTACDDTSRLLASLPQPSDEQAEAVADLGHELARVRALIDSASPESQAAAEALDAKSVALGYTPLIAETRFALARELLRSEQLDASATMFEQAYVDALRVGHDEVAADAAGRLLFVVGVELGQTEVGRRWSDHALALAERGGHVRSRAWTLGALATLERLASELDSAVAHSREVVDLLEAELGPEHLETGRAYANYGVALVAADQPRPGLDWMQRAANIYSAKYGPDHRKLAPLWLNIAAARMGLDDPAQDDLAQADLERALTIHQRTGQSAKDLAYVRGGMADLAIRRGQLVEARAHREFIVQAFRDYYGAKHPIVAEAELNLAQSALLAGDLELGRTLAEGALATLSDAETGADTVAWARLVVAVLEVDSLDSGDASAAERVGDAWREFEAAGGELTPELVGWFAKNPKVDPR